MTDCHLSVGGQCVSEPFQLHDSIISNGVLLTLIMMWEEERNSIDSCKRDFQVA